MNALVKKEMRLLAPAYFLALLLALVPIWLLPALPDDDFFKLIMAAPVFGALLLALSSFGREFGLNTFALQMAQPLTRGRLWWTKVLLLAAGVASLLIGFNLSVRAARWFFESGSGSINWLYIVNMGAPGPVAFNLGMGVALAAACAGGLWATLLVRQISTAFWLAVFVPATILMLNFLWLEGTSFTTFVVLLLYSVAGFWWARRRFFRSEEVAWTGGEVVLPAWKAGSTDPGHASRASRPMAALLWKELQLHQVALLGMAGLFLLHLGTVALRKYVNDTVENALLRSALELSAGIWLVVPLVTGSLSVADERRLGTMEGQLCLPVSTRRQFTIKLVLALTFCGLLSALLLWLAEGTATALGVGSGLGGIRISLRGDGLWPICVVLLTLELVTFYASTLTRNLMQAIATAVGVVIVLFIAWVIAEYMRTIYFIQLWSDPLLSLIALPAMALTLVWLAYENFRRLSETRRLWLHNIGSIALAMVAILMVTAGVYNRFWEFLTPLEPGHGAARWSAAQPPKLDTDGFAISVRLPDGRLWQNRVAYDPGKVLSRGDSGIIAMGGHWVGQEGSHYFDGTNWISVAAGYWVSVGVRSDGTLWVSGPSGSPPGEPTDHPVWYPRGKLVRCGEARDWKAVVRNPAQDTMFLLKTDGSLWRWGTNHMATWGLAKVMPHRLGTESDWTDLLATETGLFAWKRDGLAWRLGPILPGAHPLPAPLPMDMETAAYRVKTFDHTHWRSLAHYAETTIGVRQDGTLWGFAAALEMNSPGAFGFRMDAGTNWISVATGPKTLIALKADGSLWNFGFWNDAASGWRLSPAPLGSHQDWLAIGGMGYGVISLAADGSLWLWPGPELNYTMLAPSRKPSKIGNVFQSE